ncbi:PBECR3 domain-containing polyvalent protein [Parvimonas sp. C2]|uniref:PBECR3 domain-containing polyvalent protein n=1 Tax=Parvimonas sp. C2 TaxID=3110692 RepID=UPI002B47B3EF|nr:PBECR2 nuclease fold domain-containing protein [Parvimonas sp. C2]MEB3072579.1 PBECR2 nuclease fold domain-containing protein [Parvimonas sp. C2]
MIVKDSIKKLLGLETDLSEIEYSRHGLKRHLEKRKHYDVLKYVDNVKEMIENPDYVGINRNGNKLALEYVKCYKKNVLLALKVNKTKDKFFIVSMYSINDYKLNSRKFSGRLKKVDKE